MRILRVQIVTLALVAIGVAVLGWIRRNGLEWQSLALFAPLAYAVVGPCASAWDLRARWRLALGVPLILLTASDVAVWLLVAITTKVDSTCRGPHSPCEGLGILLAVYPFFALATLALAAIVGGAIRGVTRLVARR